MVTGKKEMEKEVRDLKFVVHDMNERLRDTEQYLSTDCLIIKNPPFDARENAIFLREVLNYFELDLKINGISKEKMRAYHILPGYEKLPHNFTPKIKKTVYEAEKRIFGKQNAKNGLMIYFNERLPPLDANLQNEIASLGDITLANNCAVTA